MKILTITSHITSNALPCFQRNKTGFGYMVHDIIEALSKEADVDVLVFYYRYAELQLDGARYIGCSWWNIISNLYNCLSPAFLLKNLWKYRMSQGAIIRFIYSWLLTGYYRRIFQKGKYDVVHVHGCMFQTELWMKLCLETKIPFVVTLHGLTSFSDTVNIEESGKKYERNFLERVVKGDIPITVISTGMKKLILKTFNLENCDNIKVICNSFSFSHESRAYFDIRQKYGLPQNSKIILYVGNVSRRKNQKQIADAFVLLPPEIINNTYVLFLGGNDEPGSTVSDFTKNHPYADHFVACGIVDKSIVPIYYAQGNAVALLSLSEGFGLSLIEGMHYGLPAMCFDDIDAFDDIYDECAIVGIREHNDEAVANAMLVLLERKWDGEKIKQSSSRFDIGSMANSYLQYFKVYI